MLNSFCFNTDLNFAFHHDQCKVNYTNNFNMCRFNVHHFCYLISDININNLSDHEPIVLQLSLGVHCVGFRDRIYSPRVSSAKATDDNMRDYKVILRQKLQSINLPTDVLLCSEINCTNNVHFQQLDKYVTDIIESCISAAESAIPCTCSRQNSGRIAGWTSGSGYGGCLLSNVLSNYRVFLD